VLHDPSATPQPKAFEPSQIRELLQDDPEAQADVLLAAFRNLKEIVEQLSVALIAGNLSAAIALSHELRGVSSNIGAEELASLGRELDTALRSSQSVATVGYTHSLDAAYDRFLAQARAFLDTI
jgi:HPt (histidine-containing phosphotransfer) domain-containing protein